MGDCAEQRPVAVGECGSLMLAAKHDELVAQDDALYVFGAA